MRRVLAVAAVLFSLFAGGCSGWQATRSSEAVDIDPLRGNIQPASGPGFMNGLPQDMRTH
jgi:hypothetical protein